MVLLPMEALSNARYGSWRPLTNLTQTFQACHLCTFNVATISSWGILTYGVLPYAMIVGVASTFETVGHVQQSVRRITKHTLKEFQDMSDVSNTSPNIMIWLFLETAIICFASCCSLILIDLTMDFMG